MNFKTAKHYRGGRRRPEPQVFPVLLKKPRPKFNYATLSALKRKFEKLTPQNKKEKEMLANTLATQPVRRVHVVLPGPSGRGSINLQFEGEDISNIIQMVPHEAWVASWDRVRPIVYVDEKLPVEYIWTVAVHEAIEKYICTKYGLSDKAEGHDASEEIEKTNFLKTNSNQDWMDYMCAVRQVYYIEQDRIRKARGGKSKSKLAISTESIKWLIDQNEEMGTDGKIVKMSPDEYLSKVPSMVHPGFPASLQKDKDYCHNSIKYIEGKIAKGDSIGIPWLDYSREFRGWPSHEGRHRAFVAKKMGIKQIPVFVIKSST